MKKIELLAPAGDLDKLKLAYIYGADAVYIGGKSFSLRYFASNFDIDEIRLGAEFAHFLNRKLYVAVNMFIHDEELSGLKDYLIQLKNVGVDAIITSSLNVLNIAKSINLETHMSTQLSLLNSEAVNFYHKLGATRVVLGRELSIGEIKKLKENTASEIEVFIHGGMCSSYSGKCMLSNEMCNRDPNRGGCAHSCRWKYHLYDENGPLFEDENYLSMSSKDLCLLNEVPQLIDAGVDSLKIEGRMKSMNYLAIIVSLYRHAIDCYYKKKEFNLKEYEKLLSLAENREFGHGFIYSNVTKNEMLLDINDHFAKPGEFIGIVRAYDEDKKIAKIEIKNKIQSNNKYLLISPSATMKEIKLGNMFYKGEKLDQYTIAGDVLEIECLEKVSPYDLIHL